MKKKKKKKKMEDRISILPNCLLHKILCFLNTQQVLQTCVLSKRWKTLWDYIPALNICSKHHKFKRASSERESLFKRFILRVLSEHC
ncbi:putative F-box/FBD/LRR-repeat protein At1g78760 [Cucumis melo]|uniref:F-box/FBD/LRR-repeat protein At1g78760 n=1 Tax=Cucumis melo TaxID=3656 RepID=A0ABM3KZR6_CUCME|nr:putative F-box/FBD/LRR-repeat protein At1g78760 [Cucumis melo]